MLRYSLLLFFLFTSLFSQELRNIKLQLQWKHQFEFAGFYAAKEKGFYKDIGIDIEFLEFKSGDNIVKNVLSKKADFGTTYSSIVAEYLNDKPLVMLANYFKQSPLVLVTQKNIRNLKDLKGKKVMGVSDDIDSINLNLMLKSFGVSLNDIKSIPPTFNTQAFIDKEVDAIAVFTTNEIYDLDKKGIKYNLFNPSVYSYEYYDLNLFTSKEFAKNNKLLTTNFRDATNKGWKYAIENKEEIVELIIKKYNTQNKTKESLLFEAEQIEQLMLSQIEELGSIDLNRVKLIGKNFIEAGFANSKNLNNISSLIFDYYNPIENGNLILSDKEKKYLRDKEFITMCIDPNWEPYEKLVDGKYTGLVSGFMKLLEKKLGRELIVIPTKTWSESIKNVKKGRCEIISFLNSTPERKEYLNFTPILHEESDVIIARNDVTYIDGLNSLNGKTVGLVKGYRTEEFIRINYPKIKIYYIKNNEEGVRLVSEGKIYATINSLLGAAHLLKKLQLVNLKIAGKTNISNKYRVGIVKKDLTLKSILSKAVLSLEQNEKEQILSKNLAVIYEKKIDYDLIMKISFVFFVILVILISRHYSIKKINKQLEEKMQIQLQKLIEKDRMIFQQNKLVAMGDMIENIAHQWRQPLSQINSAILVLDNELYQNNIKNKTIEEKLTEIENVTKYMSHTINDFRNFYSKSIKKEKFYVNESIQKVLSIIKSTFSSSNIDIELKLEKDITFYGYENELKQTLLVVLNNAKDALISRKIENAKVEITLEKKEGDIFIKISDNAGGIEEKIIDKIFDPYFTTKHKSQGTGLGLYISKVIIQDRLKGKLYVKNENGKACFYIKLEANNENQ